MYESRPRVGDTWYRYEDVRYAPMVDEFENPTGPGRSVIKMRSYKVEKITPKGVWVNLGGGYLRFILASAKKRYACPTKEEALASFIARKECQVSILFHQLETAKHCLHLGRKMKETPLNKTEYDIYSLSS